MEMNLSRGQYKKVNQFAQQESYGKFLLVIKENFCYLYDNQITRLTIGEKRFNFEESWKPQYYVTTVKPKSV
jgi:hypothetical protein